MLYILTSCMNTGIMATMATLQAGYTCSLQIGAHKDLDHRFGYGLPKPVQRACEPRVTISPNDQFI